MQCKQRCRHEDVSCLQASLVSACRDGWGYAHLWIVGIDLPLPGQIYIKDSSSYLAQKQRKFQTFPLGLRNFLALFLFLEVRAAEEEGTLRWEESHRTEKSGQSTGGDMHIAGGFKRGNDCLTAFIREGCSLMKRRISTVVFCSIFFIFFFFNHPNVGRKQSLAPTVL